MFISSQIGAEEENLEAWPKGSSVPKAMERECQLEHRKLKR
jgi:hypothetical protein